jgi:predicted MFS family arabinose efflux permease
MTTSTLPTPTSERRDPARLPWAALLVMALTGFIIIATETMPAGLLPQIATGLHVAEGAAGQFVSVYALGTVLAAIPAITLTRGTRRKPLLIAGILGFLVANTITAFSPDLTLSLAARFIAGAFSGLLWGMLAGYARRIVAHEHSGRALAIAMTGTPVALSVGTPLGSWIGTAFDWRWSFGAMSVLSILALILAVALVPDAPGQGAARRMPFRRVIGIPGVSVILIVVFTWMLAHNIEYTYIASYLQSAGLDLPVDLALVTFGVAALIGIWVTGLVIDHNLRGLVLVSIGLFLIAGVTFIVGAHSLGAVLVAIVLWGLAFGGAATQLQTAMGEASGENADVANSLLTVSFNLAIFAAGVGGALVIGVDAVALPIVMVLFAAVALIVVAIGRRSAFPRNASRTG